MSRILAASLPVVAAGALLAPGSGDALLAASVVSAAIIAAWSVGSADSPGSRRANPGKRAGQIASAGFALSLAAGALVAAGVADAPGLFGLPRSLWGLLLGVWLVPLVVTSFGFAVAFRPPDPAALERLRAGSPPGH